MAGIVLKEMDTEERAMKKRTCADRLEQNQGSLRSLIHVFAAQWVTTGLPPRSLLGDFIPKPHLRFAAALREKGEHT